MRSLVLNFFMVLFLLLSMLVLFAGESEATELAEGENVILYALGDAMHEDQHRVSIRIPSWEGVEIQYEYAVIDPDPVHHDVYLEVYYTETEWRSPTMPDVSQQRHFQRRNQYKKGFGVEHEEAGYYLFIWANDGDEQCSFDYKIGYIVNTTDYSPCCEKTLLPVPIGLMVLVSIGISRKKKKKMVKDHE